MGWLGWTDQQALDADVNAIQVAYKGKIAMLRACYGGSERGEAAAGSAAPSRQASKTRVASRPMSARLFDSLFGKRK